MSFHLHQYLSGLLRAVKHRLRSLIKPDNHALPANVLADLTHTREELILEDAYLRQQLIILDRQVKRPLAWPRKQVLLVALASRLQIWKQALLVVEAEVWTAEARGKTTAVERAGRPHPADGAGEPDLGCGAHPGWELQQVGIQVAKGTIVRYIRLIRQPATPDQTWLTFLHNHASQIWACDFLQTYDLFFRALFVFVIVELDSRRVVHFAMARHPADAWVAQQLREATPFGVMPRFLIRDRDRKFGEAFGRVVQVTSIEVLRTPPVHAPQANAICERFWGSLRRECLDFFIQLGERHLYRMVREYVSCFNHARPHQGIGQQIPLSQNIQQARARSSPSRCWVVCITTTAEQPEGSPLPAEIR